MFPLLAFAAFAGLKFGGYVLAGTILQKFQPGIRTSAVIIAGWRTLLGIVLGPLAFSTMGGLDAPGYHQPSYLPYLYYFALFALRVCIWALVISFVFREALLSNRRTLFFYSVYGALWSCFLDLPALALAWGPLRQMPIC